MRLDIALVKRGLVATRTDAQRAIADGRVTHRGLAAGKPATMVSPDEPIALTGDASRWVSRGGYKLAGALSELAVGVAGRFCLDAGASTGGFTDVLLSAGAERVVAVDVGYGQLAWRLRQDPRVVVLDRTNVRHLRPGDVPPPPPTLVVADLSFISLTLVLGPLVAVADPLADYILLVKPQFEAGPERVGKGGVVRDPRVWGDALVAVVASARGEGLGVVAATVSSLPGPAGNLEFFVHLRRGADGDGDGVVAHAVRAGRALAESG